MVDGETLVGDGRGEPMPEAEVDADGNYIGGLKACPANLPKLMRSDRIYRGKDGRWYHSDGRIVSRAERRRAGVK